LFFDEDLVHHFRRQYLQIGRQIVVEFASLLIMKDRVRRLLDAAVQSSSSKVSGDGVVGNISAIERAFLGYVANFRFVVLSNATQAHELVEKWRNAVRIDVPFNELKADIEAASQFLLSKEQRYQTETANGLAGVASIGVVFGLAFAFLGMNVLFDGESIKALGQRGATVAEGGYWDKVRWQLTAIGVVLVAFGGLGLGLVRGALPSQRSTFQDIALKALIGVGFLGMLIGWLQK